MREFELYTKTTLDSVHVIESEKHISVFVHKNYMSTGESYKLDKKHFTKLQAYKSVSALLKFVKANQITDSASNAHSGSDSASVSSCPVPVPTPAKSLDRVQDILFVEVETAGRGKDAEIVEVSVVNSAETVLFHSFIKPVNPKHIQVYDAPTFAEVWQSLSAAIGRADIAFYNADYSKRMILQSIAKAFDTPIPKHFCALFPHNKVIDVGLRYELYNNRFPRVPCSAGRQHINSACGQSRIFWRDLSNQAADNAIKSARIYNYLSYKAVA